MPLYVFKEGITINASVLNWHFIEKEFLFQQFNVKGQVLVTYYFICVYIHVYPRIFFNHTPWNFVTSCVGVACFGTNAQKESNPI